MKIPSSSFPSNFKLFCIYKLNPRMNALKVMSDQSFNIDKNVFMVCVAQDSLGQDIGMPSDNTDDVIYLLVIGRGVGGVIIYKDWKT